MGGDCLNTGCVPSKALMASAKVAHLARTGADYGVRTGAVAADFPAVMERVHEAIRIIAPADSVERYTGLGVDVRKGHARIVDPWTVEIEDAAGSKDRLTTRAIVIAAGGEPAVPDIPGLAESGYLTSDTMWDALHGQELPERVAIVGGGPIGTEMAQAFARLGAKVTQVEHGPRLLPREDEEVSALVEAVLREEGVDVRTGHDAVRVEGEALVLRSDSGETSIPFDEIIVAVGRRARLTGYGLEALGIETGRTIAVNEWLETRFPNIYAVGDVAGPYQFTHFAAHQAWFAAVNGLFGRLRRFRADYRVLPWVTFTDPEVAHVGHNALSAKEAGIDYEIVRYDLSHLDRALAEGANRGFVKLLVEPGKDRLIGATVVAANAGELIAELVLAMKHGLGLNKILGTIHAYPTMAEANKYAAGEWKKAHKPERLLGWIERYHAWRRR
jgi:pyruvate/2-oxoglutarate dehydrogenase complex dihydrolipoamide dehydrogenase (E3) component